MKHPTWWPKGVISPQEAWYLTTHHPIRTIAYLCVGGGIGWFVGNIVSNIAH